MKKFLILLSLFVAAFTAQAGTAVDEDVKTGILSLFGEAIPTQVLDDLVWQTVDFAPNDYLRFTFVTTDPVLIDANPDELEAAEQVFRNEIVDGFCNDPDTSQLIKMLGTGLQVVLKCDNGRTLFTISMPASQFK